MIGQLGLGCDRKRTAFRENVARPALARCMHGKNKDRSWCARSQLVAKNELETSTIAFYRTNIPDGEKKHSILGKIIDCGENGRPKNLRRCNT